MFSRNLCLGPFKLFWERVKLANGLKNLHHFSSPTVILHIFLFWLLMWIVIIYGDTQASLIEKWLTWDEIVKRSRVAWSVTHKMKVVTDYSCYKSHGTFFFFFNFLALQGRSYSHIHTFPLDIIISNASYDDVCHFLIRIFLCFNSVVKEFYKIL